MTPQTRSAVGRLLVEGGQVSSFEDGCLYADRVRDGDPDSRFAEDTTRHYVNVPTGAEGLDLERDCPERCVLEGIRTYSAILARDGSNDRTATEALLMLSHFVRDLHQPLHVGFASDRGGNDISIRWNGKDPECTTTDSGSWCRENLHSVWDSLMIASYLDREGIDWRTWADRLQATINDPDRHRWSLSPVLDWADESATYTLETIYPISDKTALDSTYAELHRDVLERRIQQAGVRLAALLNAALR